ncbi:putative Natterin-like protein [Chaetomium fimeti]|uniref:Natterin-like protein n=1 Tax=Chaetomium fimeti TaxID=1854472 RepID=A0AAE0LNI1_9PEZI|nr:putative Natterin-like protein [Chaetomium fimeti]
MAPFTLDFCQTNPYVGGGGGGDWQLVGEMGSFVKRIRVYWGTSKWGSDGKKGCLTGFELDYTDGKQLSHGNTDSDQAFEECRIDIDNDEKIKEMSLYGQGDGQWDRTSLLWFQTNKDQKFGAGLKLLDENQYKMDVGSGLLIGFRGRSGNIIDSVQPLFLKKVAKQYIDNVSYPTLDLNNTGFLQMDYLDRARSMWNGAPYQVKIIGEVTKKEETTWSNKNSFGASVALEFEAGLPALFSAKTSYTLQYGHEHTWGATTSNEKKLRWEAAKEMTSEEDQFELVATYKSGKMDLEYEGTYNVLTEDGRKFSFPTKGTVKHVVVSESQIEVRYFGESQDGVTRSLEEDRALEEAAYELPEAEEPTQEDEVNDENTTDPEGVAEEGVVQDYDDAVDEETMAQAGEDEEATANEDGYVEPGYEENTAAEYDTREEEPAEEVAYEDTAEEETQDIENVEEEEAAEPDYAAETDNQGDEEAYNDNAGTTYDNQESQEAEDVEEQDAAEPDNQSDETAYNDNTEEEVSEPYYQEEPEPEAVAEENETSQPQGYGADAEPQEDAYETSNAENDAEVSWRGNGDAY